MSNSTFHVSDSLHQDGLTLFVGPYGHITPDKETVQQILGEHTSLDINVVTMKKVEAGEVNISMENYTYMDSDLIDPSEMSEVARSLYSFRMDHDYTPYTSPSHVPAGLDMVDELAQTLSMLEDGCLSPQLTNEPLTKITKIVKGKKQTIFVNSREKQQMINAGLLKERPTEKIAKKPKPVHIESAAKVVADSSESVSAKNEATENTTATCPAVAKEITNTDPVTVSNASQKPTVRSKESIVDPKPTVKVLSEEMKPVVAVDKKPAPKKEKKPVKQLPDDLALFSAPDIIRRVDKEEPSTPEREKPTTSPKAAKISPVNRSKSTSEKFKRSSVEEKDKSQDRRKSLDSKKIELPPVVRPEPVVNEAPKKQFEADDQVTVQEITDTLGSDGLASLPSAEEIRAMIHSESTKTFSMNSVLPAADLPNEDASTNLNIDAAALDLDQSILDNINTDMISEDILYQVAQSLVDNNTELQNAIDKSLNDGHLELDSGSLSASNEVLTPSIPALAPIAVPDTATVQNASETIAANIGTTQIVRPDGRIVLIPPIERPTTRSRNRKPPVSEPEPSPKAPAKKLPPKTEEKPATAGQESSDEDDDDVESDDDPNKLWCICNQPHNNRFMICCDSCEDWYHGKCVNVTKAMGQMMEQEGKDWVCIYCRDPTLKRPKAALRRMRKASRTSTDSNNSSVKSKSTGAAPLNAQSKSKPATPKSASSRPAPPAAKAKDAVKPTEQKTSTRCVVCGKQSRTNSIYCSDTCILKHAQGVEKGSDRKSMTPGVKGPAGMRAESPADAKSPKPSLKQQKPQLTQSKLKIVKNTANDGVSLAIQKKGVNVAVMPHSPKGQPSKPIILNSAVKNKVGTSTVKVVRKQSPSAPNQRGDDKPKKLIYMNSKQQSPVQKAQATATKQPSVAAKQTAPSVPPFGVKSKASSNSPNMAKKELGPLPQKTPNARQAESGNHQPKQENLRETVKKTFFEQLMNRLKNVDDLKLSDDELRQVSDEIESQLYKCFADTGQKYRNKYRSLIFNIKDPKNQTLWRRICEKSVNPYQLVRLSHDDLASQELALWRERETKHQLDMIKKSELELLNCTRQFVFKTHKGETVFEDDRTKEPVTDVLPEAKDGTATAGSGEGNEEGNSRDSKASTGKHTRRDRERSKDSKTSRDKDDKHRSKSKDHKRRSRSGDKSRHSSEKRRSRSRDRHRDRRASHKSSRHKKEEESKKDKTINTEKLDKKSKEILEQLVDKQIVPPLEDGVWKQDEALLAPQPPTPPPAVAPESDSDHEPSSTVTIPTPPHVNEVDEVPPEKKSPPAEVAPVEQPEDIDEPPSKSTPADRIPEEPPRQEQLWQGNINMVDVANITINAYEVSGDCKGLSEELPKSLDIVGRITASTVWDYISKMKLSSGKSISVLRISAVSMLERNAYLSLYAYLLSRQRLGVVKCVNKRVKDFYILPLAAHSAIPPALLPITGPGFEEPRPSLLVGVIVRDKRKRTLDATGGHHPSKKIRVEMVANSSKVPGTPPQPTTSRSYTPPPTRDPRVKLPVPNVDVPEENEDDMDEPYSPADSDPDTIETKTHLDASDLSNLLAGSAKSSFMDTSNQPTAFEPFSNKFDGIPGLDAAPSLPATSFELEKKMAELDQEIAAQKAEIDKVSKDLVSGSSDLESTTLANIALPSNLQQILESIKSIGNKADTPEYMPDAPNSNDLTMPLLLPKLSSRVSSSPDITPMVPQLVKMPSESEKSGGVLSSLSEEDLIKKAAEMLGETELLPLPPPPPTSKRTGSPLSSNAKRGRLELNQPPIPGLED